MPSNNYIYKMSNAGGMSTITRYTDMLAGNTTWNTWEPQGAYDALSTVTVPSGGVASVTFAGIPNTYKNLQIRYIVRSTRADAYGYFGMRFNSDSSAVYSSHNLYGTGSAAAANAVTSQTSIPSLQIPGANAAANIFSVGIIDLLDYQNTNKNKTARILYGDDRNGTGAGGQGYVYFTSGLWQNLSAINSITFTDEFNSLAQNSQFTLYGVK